MSQVSRIVFVIVFVPKEFHISSKEVPKKFQRSSKKVSKKFCVFFKLSMLSNCQKLSECSKAVRIVKTVKKIKLSKLSQNSMSNQWLDICTNKCQMPSQMHLQHCGAATLLFSKIYHMLGLSGTLSNAVFVYLCICIFVFVRSTNVNIIVDTQ